MKCCCKYSVYLTGSNEIRLASMFGEDRKTVLHSVCLHFCVTLTYVKLLSTTSRLFKYLSYLFTIYMCVCVCVYIYIYIKQIWNLFAFGFIIMYFYKWRFVKLVITHSVSPQYYLILVGGLKLPTSARSVSTGFKIFTLNRHISYVSIKYWM